MCVYDRVSADGCVHASEMREGGSWSGESRGAGVNPRDCVCFSEMKVGKGDGGWMRREGGREREREGGRIRSAPVLSPWVHQQQELFSALWGPSDCSVTLHRRLTLP